MSANKKYKLVVAYDGTHYAGWQAQQHTKSVANVIEKTFARVFNKSIKLTAASRTDAGVHAYGQVACLSTDIAISPQKLRWALQRSLPSAIVIRSCEEVPDSFHPRFVISQKTYWYHFFLEQPVPWHAPYGYYYTDFFDEAVFKQALQLFVGTHDFRSFCSGNDKSNTVRTIKNIELDFNPQFNAYRVVVTGNSFLRYMIRRIIGACFYITQKKMDPFFLRDVLAQKNPHQQLYTAPAQGLLLYDVVYKN